MLLLSIHQLNGASSDVAPSLSRLLVVVVVVVDVVGRKWEGSTGGHGSLRESYRRRSWAHDTQIKLGKKKKIKGQIIKKTRENKTKEKANEPAGWSEDGRYRVFVVANGTRPCRRCGRFYWPPHSIGGGHYRVCKRDYRTGSRFYRVSTCVLGSHRVLPSFTEFCYLECVLGSCFYRVFLPSFTVVVRCYSVLPSFGRLGSSLT